MTTSTSPDQDTTVDGGVSRRAVLVAGAVLLGGLLVDVRRTPGAAAATAPELLLEPLAGDPVDVVTANPTAVASFPRHLGVQVRSAAGTLPSGTAFDLEYDPRLYTPLETPVVLYGTLPVAGVSVSDAVVDEITGLARRTVVLERDVDAVGTSQEALVIVVGATRPLVYPGDLVRAPGVPTAGVPASSSSRARRRPGRRPLASAEDAAPVEGLPWGVELAATWDALTWGQAGGLSYPAARIVTVRSTGPGTMPGQVRLSMRLDAQVVRTVVCTGARVNDEPLRTALPEPSIRRGTTLEIVWRTGRALQPDDVLTLTFDTEAHAPAGDLPGIVHPVVALTGPPRAPGRQRLSRTTSITRRDAVWSSGVGADA